MFQKESLAQSSTMISSLTTEGYRNSKFHLVGLEYS